MNLLRHTVYDFMVYKISLKFSFPVCRINFTQHLACPLINHRAIIIPHDIFLKSFQCEFSYRIIHQPLIIHILINDLLLSKFIQACHADRGIRTKNNLLVSFVGVFDSLFKLFLCFHTVSTSYIQFFLQVLTETSCSFIYSLCNPRQVTKIFLTFFLDLIIIGTQQAALLFFCIGLFTLFNIRLRVIIFTFFLDRINL